MPKYFLSQCLSTTLPNVRRLQSLVRRREQMLENLVCNGPTPQVRVVTSTVAVQMCEIALWMLPHVPCSQLVMSIPQIGINLIRVDLLRLMRAVTFQVQFGIKQLLLNFQFGVFGIAVAVYAVL